MDNTRNIENFLMSITETKEYKDVEYIIFSIRKYYLNYLTLLRTKHFPIPQYLIPLVSIVSKRFSISGIPVSEMIEYMVNNDINNWVYYYVNVFLFPTLGKNNQEDDIIRNRGDFFWLILTSYILDLFRDKRTDIQKIIEGEKLIHRTNQYGLSIVNGVIFERDYFIYENKAYLYNILTNTSVIDFADTMPGFARIISENKCSGNILLRLDERLALPLEQAISYSTLNCEKFYGPQFHFNDTNFSNAKTVIIHIDEQTSNKLLMVVKKDFDQNRNEHFLHIEIETLPYVDRNKNTTNCITTFLHGMYYPQGDFFTHIDYASNQYNFCDYIKKYSEEDINVPPTYYTSKKLHYKIWCIENGEYTREVWYKLMMASLNKEYQNLLNEILK